MTVRSCARSQLVFQLLMLDHYIEMIVYQIFVADTLAFKKVVKGELLMSKVII